MASLALLLGLAFLQSGSWALTKRLYGLGSFLDFCLVSKGVDKTAGTRVYACRNVPFFVLFSVVDLRAALVFVSVRSGRVSSRAGRGRGAMKN